MNDMLNQPILINQRIVAQITTDVVYFNLEFYANPQGCEILHLQS